MRTKTNSNTKPASNPEEPVNKHLGVYIIGFVIALLTVLGSTILVLNKDTFSWEYSLFASINNWPGTLYRPMWMLTELGSVWAATALVIVTFFARLYHLAWRLALSIFGAAGVVFVAKHFIARPRPSGLFEGVHQRIVETGMGFPSWHATGITIVMLTLLPYIKPRWRWIVPLLIIVVAMSRIYLGVHSPLDVIAGIALGTVVVTALRILPQPLRVLLRID